MNLSDSIMWTETGPSIIKVIGIGGGGGNAVGYMFRQGIHNVNFVVCNTDLQALKKNPVPNKIQIGELGAGGIPEVAREAAMSHIDLIRDVFNPETRMVFITAGMGGGTGTGAAPVVARIARELGILTVAIVTLPFAFEGEKRRQQALEGISELKEHVDSLLVINNNKLTEIYGKLKMSQLFAKADNVLAMAAKGIAELITIPGEVNVDFADVCSVMTGGGITVMGSATASGEGRARKAVEEALNSPLLNTSDITGARRILLNITSGTGDNELDSEELMEISGYVTRSARNANMIFGTAINEQLGDAISVTIVATDFIDTGFIDPGFIPDGAKNTERITVQMPQTTVERTVLGQNTAADNPTYNETQGGYIVRDKTTPTQTEIRWTAVETDVAVAEPENARRAIPVIADENANVDEIENIPAYERRRVKLDNAVPGTESEMSKYTISTDKEHTPRLRDNNAYLNPIVD